MMKKETKKFLKEMRVTNKERAASNSICASLRRNLTYISNNVKDRKKFRDAWTEQLEKYAKKYSKPVSNKDHIKNIREICSAVEEGHRNILVDSKLKFGTAQKAFNLYLKYLWCFDSDKIHPPHCPLDRIVLQHADINENWTELDCEVTYQKWIDVLKKKADKYDSLQHWELSIWNKRY